MMKPKGLRNNNPLNIRVSADKWQGAMGDDGQFVKFETAKHGIRAAAKILKTYATKYQLHSINGIISRWAPPIENNTANYIAMVERRTGIDQHQKLGPEQYPNVMAAMIKMENGSNPFSIDEIRQGFEWGFYG